MIIRTNECVHSEDYVLKVLRAKDKNVDVIKIDRIYYPYAILIYQIQMKNPKSQMNRKIMCVMDQVGGRGAIGDEDPPLVEAEVEDIIVMDALMTGKQLYDKAHDYIFKMVMSKVRVLYVPHIALVQEDYFHKLFYIVHCRDTKEQDYFLLADSMDASFTFLEHQAPK